MKLSRWLPGRLTKNNGSLVFNYGQTYLVRLHNQQPVMPIYSPELPLQAGVLPLLEGLNMPGLYPGCRAGYVGPTRDHEQQTQG